ncbi:MAG: cupin domain-containing protein [Benniella sp.]|nr:MAG: cupin domain-containing protein [Benniella sp.]
MKLSRFESLPVAYVSHDLTVEKRVMLKHGEVPHVSQLAIATLKPNEVASNHKHDDMTETFCFQSGTGEMEVDGVIHVVEAGTTVTVHPNEEHEIRNTGSENLVVLYFGIIH